MVMNDNMENAAAQGVSQENVLERENPRYRFSVKVLMGMILGIHGIMAGIVGLVFLIYVMIIDMTNRQAEDGLFYASAIILAIILLIGIVVLLLCQKKKSDSYIRNERQRKAAKVLGFITLLASGIGLIGLLLFSVLYHIPQQKHYSEQEWLYEHPGEFDR